MKQMMQQEDVVNEASACEECGFEYSHTAHAACPRCGGSPGSPIAPKAVNTGLLRNSYADEYTRIKQDIDAGRGFASDLDNYLLVVEGKALGGDAMAQQFLGSQIYREKDAKRALELLRESALENAHAAYTLGIMHVNGEGTPPDVFVAIKHFRMAASKGHPYAIYALSHLYSEGKALVRDETKAAALMRLVAEGGYVEAQYYLSSRYYGGIGVEVDIAQALMWCRLAADRGYAPAEHSMAGYFDRGIGVAEDRFEATRWLERASTHGDFGATLALSIRFCHGIGTEKDPKRAFYLATSAVERGLDAAMWQVSYYYRLGIGMKMNAELADRWLFKALDSGAQEAWNPVKPETAEKEFPSRMKWAGDDNEKLHKVYQWARSSGYDRGVCEVLLKGTALGDPIAECDLAFAYLEGKYGIEKNVKEAIRLYTLASDAGDPVAQCNLAHLYHSGTGVERDLEKAEELVRKSIATGYSSAEHLLATWLWNESPESAVALLESAVAKDDIEALRFLGLALVQGDHVQQDVSRGFDLLKCAAELGDAISYVVMGDLYINGKSIKLDYNAAFRCYERGAQLGDSEAVRMLSEMYGRGWGCPQDAEKARELLNKAIELGNQLAVYRFGELLLLAGKYDEAIAWCEKARSAGNPHCKYLLAVMYWRGAGFEQNAEKAIKLAREAVSEGATDAEGLVLETEPCAGGIGGATPSENVKAADCSIGGTDSDAISFGRKIALIVIGMGLMLLILYEIVLNLGMVTN